MTSLRSDTFNHQPGTTALPAAPLKDPFMPSIENPVTHSAPRQSGTGPTPTQRITELESRIDAMAGLIEALERAVAALLLRPR